MHLSEARLGASDVGALVRGVDGFVRRGQLGALKGCPAVRGPQLRGVGRVCRVEECAEWVRCSFVSAEGGVEPTASDSEVGFYLLWCRLCPRFRRRGCCLGGRGLCVWEVEVTVVGVQVEQDVAGCHVQAAPAVAQGRSVGGQGCAARGHGYGPHVVCCLRYVVPSRVVPEGIGEWLKEARMAGRGVRLGPRAAGGGVGRGPRSGGSG